MRVLIAGASGLIGKALTAFLSGRGCEVVVLSRKKKKGAIYWDPEEGWLDACSLEGFDAFVNLSGESVSGRWTAAKKKAILESRVKSTALLCQAIEKLKSPPKILVNASAVGYYGSQEDRIVDEDSSSGTGFLAEVCRQWERAAEPAKQRGVRVVTVRIGVVLSKQGGVLAGLYLPFKLGLGGRVGSGRQYMSWISLKDLVHVIDFIVRHESIEGPVNAVSPCPVTNAEFTKALGKALKRPTVLPLPAFAARFLFGEMADGLLLSSTRVHPTKLQKAGYSYYDPYLEVALRKEFA